MADYENLILDSVEMIVQNALDNAKYDRTIQAKILKCTDSLKGIYTVKYQDAKFTAYASNVEDIYTEGTSVYILVPENNMQSHKTILGVVKNNNTQYSTIVLDSYRFFEISTSFITLYQELSICSYDCMEGVNGTIPMYMGEIDEEGNKISENNNGILIYDSTSDDSPYQAIHIQNEDGEEIQIDVKDGDTKILSIDIGQLKLIFKKNIIHALRLGGVFRTSLPEEQQGIPGDYGIYIEISGIYNKEIPQEMSLTIGTKSMIGNPYQLFVSTEQVNYKDLTNFEIQSINKIVFYGKDFPEVDISDDFIKQDNIFLSDIICTPCYQLSDEEIQNLNLYMRLPQGIYFREDSSDTDTRLLEAVLRKGMTDLTDSEQANYYWFEQNGKVNFQSGYYEGYDKIGGDGWRCLNSLDTTGEYHVPDSSKIKIQKKDLPFLEKEYMCAVTYDSHILKKKVTLYNHGAKYEISLSSSGGTTFGSTSTGSTDIEVKVYKNENSIRTEMEATNYDVSWYTCDDYNNYLLRVSHLKTININLAEFTSLYTINCVVTIIDEESEDNGVIGTKTIELRKIIESDKPYSLIIHNSNGLFLYDEAGFSPVHPQNQEQYNFISPIEYEILDNTTGTYISGNNLPADFALWEYPSSEESLIIGESGKSKTGIFDIANKYDFTKINNEIKLTVTYQGETLKASIPLFFAKQGEIGTNGTKFVAKIIPNETFFGKEGQYLPIVPLGTNIYGFTTSTGNFEGFDWFNVELYYDGILIHKGHEPEAFPNLIQSQNEEILSGNPKVKIKWDFITSSKYDKCSFAVTRTGKFYIKDSTTNSLDNKGEEIQNFVNIIQATVSLGNNLSTITSLPIATIWGGDNPEKYYIEEYTGFRYVVYQADRTNPQYANLSPFRIKNREKETENITIENWQYIGESYYNGMWQKNEALEKKDNFFIPAKIYDGYSLSNAVYGTFNGYKIHIPIHFYLNRYANSAVNNWDGNKIVLNNEDGVILAPQVIAGKKESDNSFTGAFMGTVRYNNNSDESGFMAYSHGKRSIFLDAETGAATFGLAEKGSIKIDPNSNGTAVIEGGAYKESKDGGQGLRINFGINPSIKFGSGNFEVSPQGILTAQGAKISGSFFVKNPKTGSIINLTDTKSSLDFYHLKNNFIEGHTHIGDDNFYIEGYELVQDEEGESRSQVTNYLKYDNGKLRLKGEFNSTTDSSAVCFSDNPSQTYIRFWKGEEENPDYKAILDTRGLELDNYGNNKILKSYLKFNSQGLSLKGTFSAETENAKIRFSDKLAQNYIKFIDKDDNGIIRGESEWSPNKFALKAYGPDGKQNNKINKTEVRLEELFKKYEDGEISEEQYNSEVATCLNTMLTVNDSSVSSLIYSNGKLKYKGDMSISTTDFSIDASPYAKLVMNKEDAKGSYLYFKNFLPNDETARDITEIKPGSLQVRTYNIKNNKRTSKYNELLVKNGKIRLKGELTMDTSSSRVRFANTDSYLRFTNLLNEQDVTGKQTISPSLFRLATYTENATVDSALKFQDDKLTYTGDMSIRTENGIFEMTKNHFVLRMGEINEEGKKTTDFRLTPRGFAFRAYGPKKEEDVFLKQPKTKTTIIKAYTTEDIGNSVNTSMHGTYNNVSVYLADCIPEDNVTIDQIQEMDEMFKPTMAIDDLKDNSEDLGISLDADGKIINDGITVDRYTEYEYQEDETGEEYISEKKIFSEEYENIIPNFMKTNAAEENWVETSGLVYDSKYKKLRLHGDLSIRNDHGSVILTDELMRITFKSQTKWRDQIVPATRMNISDNSFYFYSFGANTVYRETQEADSIDGTVKTVRRRTQETKWGITGGIRYANGKLRIIGEINADEGVIGGLRIRPNGFYGTTNNITIQQGGVVVGSQGAINNNIVYSGGSDYGNINLDDYISGASYSAIASLPGGTFSAIAETSSTNIKGLERITSVYGDRRVSLIKGRFLLEGNAANDEILKELQKVLNDIYVQQLKVVTDDGLNPLKYNEEDILKLKDSETNENYQLNDRYTNTTFCFFSFPHSVEELLALEEAPPIVETELNDAIIMANLSALYGENVTSQPKSSSDIEGGRMAIYYTMTNNILKTAQRKLQQIAEKTGKKVGQSDIAAQTKSGWRNFGSIYGGKGLTEGINIVSEGYKANNHLVYLEDFLNNRRIIKTVGYVESNQEETSETDILEGNEEKVENVTRKAYNGIYFGIGANVETFDITQSLRSGSNVESNIEDTTTKKEDPESYKEKASQVELFTGNQVIAIENFKNNFVEVEDDKELDKENMNPWLFFKDKIGDYNFIKSNALGKLGFILGRYTKPKTTLSTDTANNNIYADVNDNNEKAAYVFGTEIFPHLVKTNDIYIHSNDLNLYRSKSLVGILNELHSLPKKITYSEEDLDHPTITEEWEDAEQIYYDKNYQQQCNKETYQHIWEIELSPAIEGQKQEDREVKSLILKANKENGILEDIKIELSGF